MNYQSISSKMAYIMLIGFAFNGVPQAATIDLNTGSGNGADTFVSTWPGDRDANFGSADTFFLKNDLGSGFVNRKGYLRFDLSSINNPISDVSLRIGFVDDTHTTFATWSFNVYGLSDGHSGENWVETDITWNNAPANNTSSGGGLLGGQASFLGSFDIDTSVLVAGDLVDFSSPGLTSFIQNDTNDLATLIFIRSDLTLSNVGFATKEHANFAPPTLALSTSPIPIPAGAILFGSGLVGLIGYHYRNGRKVLLMR